jgi:membrane fusion protein, multidrug efflux system
MPQITNLAPAPSRREKGLFLCLAALLSVSCGGKKAAGGFAPPPTAVEVAAAAKEPVRATLHALGTVEATESVKISAELDALVRELPFEEGRLVRKGQTLAVLNDSELAAEVHRAAALRNQAELNWKRADELVKKKISSSQEENNARAAFDVADANWKLAQARLAKTRIVAPFEGLVGRRLVSPGAFLRVGDVITDLARIDQVKVAFSIPERYLPEMRRGSSVAISTVAYPGHGFAGTVVMVSPILDASTRSAGIVAVVPNPRLELRPGMSADVTAVLSERAGAVTVPAEAVFAEGDRNFLYVVKPDATVDKRAVTLGLRQAGKVEVTQGLQGGEKVVRAGYQKLFPGAKVAPVESAKEPTGAAAKAGSP